MIIYISFIAVLGIVAYIAYRISRSKMGTSHTALDTGSWAWGAILLGIVLIALWIIIYAAQNVIVGKDGIETFKSGLCPSWFPGLYHVVQELSTVIGACIAFGGLAWSYFFIKKRNEDSNEEPSTKPIVLILKDGDDRKRFYEALKNEFEGESESEQDDPNA